MRWSGYFLPTLKSVSLGEDDTPGLRLLLQAGLVRQLASGIYAYLPFGLAVLRNIEAVIRREMNRAGAVELLMPALQPTALWKESGRYELLGRDIVSFKFPDRHKRELLLGPTHEEVILELARHELNSWRHLPLVLYQVQTKFRDEMRPRYGLVRGREFLMKDAYSFDRDEAGLEESYGRMRAAYERIFKTLGLRCRVERADSGAIGGSFSEEFVSTGECPELEVGHIFKLGTTYSEKMKGFFLDEQGRQRPYVMGCYGIGVSRLIPAVVEANFDPAGIIWPPAVAPFTLHILPVNYGDSAVREAAGQLYAQALDAGVPALLDDRPRGAGEKFKDADLIGLPFRVTVGRHAGEGRVELKARRDESGTLLALAEVLPRVRRLLED